MTLKPPVSAERQAFEAWLKRTHTGANVMRTRKGYVSETTRVAWRAWQASRARPAAPPAPPPAPAATP